MNDASSLARNATAAAISPGSANRPIGMIGFSGPFLTLSAYRSGTVSGELYYKPMFLSFIRGAGRFLLAVGKIVLTTIQQFSKTPDEAIPITRAPYSSPDATDPHNALGRLSQEPGPRPRDDSWRSR